MDATLEHARTLVAEHRWAEAHDAFAAADPSSLSGDDLTAFAEAAWWVSRLDEALDLRRRSYAWFESAGDDAGAAGAAARLAIEHFLRREP